MHHFLSYSDLPDIVNNSGSENSRFNCGILLLLSRLNSFKTRPIVSKESKKTWNVKNKNMCNKLLFTHLTYNESDQGFDDMLEQVLVPMSSFFILVLDSQEC